MAGPWLVLLGSVHAWQATSRAPLHAPAGPVVPWNLKPPLVRVQPRMAPLEHPEDRNEFTEMPTVPRRVWVRRGWRAVATLSIVALWIWPWILEPFLSSSCAQRLAPALSQQMVESASQVRELKVVVVRLLVASGCGAIIGVERKDADRPAGLRSLTLVSVGAALYTLSCTHGISRGDQARAAAQVCTGVGFIGAGVIAKGSIKDPVRGVTTACAVWVSAAIGTAPVACPPKRWLDEPRPTPAPLSRSLVCRSG